MTAEVLTILKQNLLGIVPKGLGEALVALKAQLPPYTARIGDLIQLESQLKEVNKAKIKGIISQEDLNLRYNQIREELISFIQSLEITDFAAATAAVKQGRQGSLLYNIPDQMRLAEEARCVVRLAFDEDVIIENIELEASVVLKTVRVAAVMQAEILDPNSQPSFAIRTISRAEQFLEEGAYTEWIYYVTPLREGTFPLLIKVAVLEVIQGKERAREIVWEEEVQIVTANAAMDSSIQQFKPTGYAFMYGDAQEGLSPQAEVIDRFIQASEKEAAFPKRTPVTNKVEQSVAPIPQPNLPLPQPRRKSSSRTLSTLLSLMLVASLSYVLMPSFFKGDENTGNKSLGPLDKPTKEPNDSIDITKDTIPFQDTLQKK
ncbi:MAG: hypothetical protein R2828_08265 [Saprospiraceae bacterium]